MNGQLAKCLLLLLLINDFIQAVPKIEEGRSKLLNNKLKLKNKQSRSLQAGDTITPEELVEVTSRLLKKVKKGGKGIISSSKNEYELADKLFERYFLKMKRIVIIKVEDVDGLDAIQALSLDGDVVKNHISSSESFTEAPRILFHGFKMDPMIKLYGYGSDDYPNRCHYKVMKKWIEEPTAKNGKNKLARRQETNLQHMKKKLGKNRKLVVNPGRRDLVKNKSVGDKHNYQGRNIGQMTRDNKKTGKISDQNRAHQKRKSKSPRTRNDKNSQRASKTKNILSSNASTTTVNETLCRWKYRCEVEFDLQTCRLHPICSNQTDFNITFNEEEPNEHLREFRRMVGVSIFDEKLEKIIEAHILRIRPQNMQPDKKVENLIKYFNKIVDKNGALTSPMPRSPTLKPHAMDEDDLEARRILGLIPDKRHKPFSTIINKRLA